MITIRYQKQDGKKTYSEQWKRVVYQMETGRTDFFADRVSKDVAIRHRTTTYITIRERLLDFLSIHVTMTYSLD
jgi:hypothetical protein